MDAGSVVLVYNVHLSKGSYNVEPAFLFHVIKTEFNSTEKQ